MRLTKLTLENFRSFKGKHEIEFSPITLLFGGNSVGKSSITKAIQRHAVLADEDIFYGEKSVSVGLHFEGMNLDKNWNAYKTREMDLVCALFRQQNKATFEFFDTFSEQCKTVAIENQLRYVDVSTDKSNKLTELHRTRYFINGEWLLGIEADLHPEVANCTFSHDEIILNLNHPILQIDGLKQSAQNLNERFSKLNGQNRGYSVYLLNECLNGGEQNSAGKIQDLAEILSIEDEKLRLLMLDISRLVLIIRTIKYYIYNAQDIDYLGPLRTLPDSRSCSKLLHPVKFDSPYLNNYNDYSFKKDRNTYTGEDTWSQLNNSQSDSIRKYSGLDNEGTTLDQVNDWLVNWFNTPYQIKIYESYSLEVDNDQIRKKLKKGQISKDDLISVGEKIRFLNVQNHSITPATEIGIGISQLTPVIVNALESKSFSVEQPELHIHPRMQTILADLFVFEGLYTKAKKNATVTIQTKNLDGSLKERSFVRKQAKNESFMLLETHSEHLILRLLKRMREDIIKPDDLAVYYFENDNGQTKINKIGVDQEGEFTSAWPEGFFEERLEELF